MPDTLIPSHMPASEFMELVHTASGIGPAHTPSWRKPDLDAQIRARGHLQEAVLAFIDRPRKKYLKYKEEISALFKSSDLPDPVTDQLSRFEDMTNFDMFWMDAFMDASQFIEPGRDFWEVLTDTTDTNTGQGGKFGWTVVPEGDAVKLQTIDGELTSIKVRKYGSGIEWTDELIRFRRVAVMIDLAEKFRRGYNTDKSDRFYTLLTNASHDTLEEGTGATEVEQDLRAIEGAAENILEGVKDTRNLPAGTELLLYVPLSSSGRRRARIMRALGEVSQAFSGSTQRVTYNVRPIFSFNSNLPTASSGFSFAALMVIPGHKSQWAQLMDVTMFEDRDIKSLSFMQTAFAYYGGGILDTNQILTLNFA